MGAEKEAAETWTPLSLVASRPLLLCVFRYRSRCSLGKQVVQTLPGGQGLEPGSNLSPSCVRAAVCTALGRGFAVSRTCSRCSLSSCSPQREAPATGAAPPREFGEVGRSAPSRGQTGERPPPVHAASPVPSPLLAKRFSQQSGQGTGPSGHARPSAAVAWQCSPDWITFSLQQITSAGEKYPCPHFDSDTEEGSGGAC